MKNSYSNTNSNLTFLFTKCKEIVFLLLVLFFGLMPISSFGQTNTWNGSSSTAWNTAGNWSLGVVPLPAHDVVIPNVANKPIISVASAVCNTLTINNAGASANSLTITSPGTLAVTGVIAINNTASANVNTTIAVGTASLTAASISMNNSGSDSKDCILSLSTGTVTVSGNITMAGLTARNQVTFTGAGTLNLGGTITGGGLTPSTGVVNYDNLGAQSIGLYNYANLTLSGSGIKTLGRNTTMTRALSVKANTTLALGGFTLAGPTSLALECSTSTGSNITGAGLLTLAGNVTVTGLGTDTSGASIACPVALGANRTFTIADSGATIDLGISGTISGAFSVTKAGPGFMNLSGANTYTGTTPISAGTLQIGNVTAVGTSSRITVTSGAVLDLNGITLSTARPLTLNGTGISSAGALINSSATAVTYSGLITLGSASSIISNAGTITISNAGNITGTFDLTLGGSANGVVSSSIRNSTGGLTKTGTGTWTLSGVSTYTGTTTVSAGTLKLGGAGSGTNTPLGKIAGITTVATGAVLDLNGFTLTTAEPLTLNGTGIASGGALINSSATAVTYSGLITLGSASSIISNTGTITTSNVGTITGPTFDLTLGGSGNGVMSSIIGTTTGGLTKIGTGTWTLSGSNTFTGATNVNAGTISLGKAQTLTGDLAIASGATLTTANFALTFQGNFTNSGTFTAGSSIITLGGVANQSIDGFTTTGTVSVTKTAGVATLAGVLSAGSLALPSTGPFLNLGTGTHTAGTLTIVGVTQAIGSWGGIGSGATYIDSVRFANASGKINVNSGTCTTGNWIGGTSTDWNTPSNWCGGVPSSSTNVVIPAGTTFQPSIASGATAVCLNLTINSGATLSLANAFSLNISGNFVSNGSFSAGATSTTNFVGANQNVGNASFGILNFSGTAAKTLTGAIIATGDVTINSGATLVTADNTVTFERGFTNSGTFTAGNSDIVIGGGVASQSIAGFSTTGNVLVTKTAGTATFTGPVNGGGLSVTASGATLKLGSFTHTFTGIWHLNGGTLNANSSTLIIGGDITGGGNFNAGTGTVVLNGTNQSITQSNFYNLTFSGTGTKTFLSFASTIANIFAIASGVVADLGEVTGVGLVHTANLLTIGGVSTVSGSWGSTTSTALNTNNTYFAATKGIVNVSTGACIPPVPTFTASPSGSVCMNMDITYTTQSGQENYLWTVSGVLNTDYSISSGGIGSTDSTVDLKWLTTGSKTVTVNYKNIGGCTGTTAATNTVTVDPDAGPISLNGTPFTSNSATTYCASNKAIFSIAPVSGASGYIWVYPGDWTVVSGQGTTTLTITTGTTSGTVSVTASNLFCPSNLGVTLNTIPPVAPLFSKTDLTCAIQTGTITVTSPAPASGTVYTLTGTVPPVAPVTNTSGSFTSLTAGDYVVTYQINSGCVSTSTAAITIVPLVTNTWNGSWSTGSVPTANELVVFAGNYSGPSVDGCSCGINSPATVTIGSGQVLKLENELNVETGGTLIFLNGASLVQTNDVANSGDIHYRRTTSAVQDFDYVYWSSPVAGQTLGALSILSDKYWSWGVDNWVVASGSDVMAEGQGYIARVPRYTTPQEVEFVGVPFNGDVTVPSKGDAKGNLVGNPYPCAVDAIKFLDANGSFMSTETLYFWTHVGNRTLNGTGTQYEYSSNDYASFNRSGGLKAFNGGARPNGTIGAGQSFFVIGKGSDPLTFNNSMRLDEFNAVNDNSQFFKQANTKKTEKKEKHRVWLNLTNDGGAFKQLLIGYITGASNGFDKSFDGLTFNGNTFVDFYSINESKKYAIQGRGLPFDPEDEVPLGYKTSIAGTFQIGIDEVDGGMVNQEIYLEDKTTNTIHDLTKGSYSFTTAIGEFKDRFVLRYTDTKLGTDDVTTNEKGVVVSVKNSQIKINSFDNTISSVKVYDLKGSLLYEKDKLDKNEFSIDHFNSSDQFMIVMVQLEDGKWISKEIIFHD